MDLTDYKQATLNLVYGDNQYKVVDVNLTRDELGNVGIDVQMDLSMFGLNINLVPKDTDYPGETTSLGMILKITGVAIKTKEGG